MLLSVRRVTTRPRTSFLLKDKLKVRKLATRISTLWRCCLGRSRSAAMLHEPSERLNFKNRPFHGFRRNLAWRGGQKKTAKIAVYVWEKIKFGAQWVEGDWFSEYFMSYKELIWRSDFDLLWDEELQFYIFIQMSLNCFANCAVVLQTNVWENKNYNCGFSGEAISLKIVISTFFYPVLPKCTFLLCYFVSLAQLKTSWCLSSILDALLP